MAGNQRVWLASALILLALAVSDTSQAADSALFAGGVTSIPAAMAVWALARPQVFALYIGLSLSGAFASGLLFQLWTQVA